VTLAANQENAGTFNDAAASHIDRSDEERVTLIF
jgi:hypothetical protein